MQINCSAQQARNWTNEINEKQRHKIVESDESSKMFLMNCACVVGMDAGCENFPKRSYDICPASRRKSAAVIMGDDCPLSANDLPLCILIGIERVICCFRSCRRWGISKLIAQIIQGARANDAISLKREHGSQIPQKIINLGVERTPTREKCKEMSSSAPRRLPNFQLPVLFSTGTFRGV
jgi:hypothetical protein